MTIIRCTFLFLAASGFSALADTFGTGSNQFTIDFAEIGSPGNPGHQLGKPLYAGAVGYNYRIGTYEVSTSMVGIANSVGGLGLDYTGRSANKPATDISWNEAARFVNWLNTSMGSAPAYKFAAQPGDPGYSANANISLWQIGEAGYDSANPFRNALARYFLPSSDEWYKAAYYNPVTGRYATYPNGSPDEPIPVSAGTNANTAVYNNSPFDEPADVNNAGSLSPFGTMAQGGNVAEWQESTYYSYDTNGDSSRSLRGGTWSSANIYLSGASRMMISPTYTDAGIGFRVASVPEPGTSVLAFVGCLVIFSVRKLLIRRATRTSIMAATAAMALITEAGHAQLAPCRSDALTKIYDQRDLSTITGEPNVGAKPVQVIKTEDGVSKVYDQRDLSTITDEPNIGAKPVQVIKTEAGMSKVYDRRDLSTITDEPNLGAKPVQVIKTEDGLSKIYDQRDLSTITDEPNLGAKPVQVIKAEDGVSKIYDQRDLSTITDEPNLGAKPTGAIVTERGQAK